MPRLKGAEVGTVAKSASVPLACCTTDHGAIMAPLSTSAGAVPKTMLALLLRVPVPVLKIIVPFKRLELVTVPIELTLASEARFSVVLTALDAP